MSYNPIPPRVWSRVQNQCTFTVPGSTYTQAYIPLTGQTVSQAQANYEEKLIYKGNILQYKGNSSRLTKSQKYTQLAKGFGPSRKKVYATQSQTYTNPNTTGLQRINYETYPYPNSIVSAPNNPSGPFQYNVQNPNGCLNNSIQDGGTLVCGTYINPCTGEIIKQGTYSATICNPASASDVPGSSILCWNNKVETWFPKPRYVMNNSTDKWPVNYKGFVSAVDPSSYTICLTKNNTNNNYSNLNILSNLTPIDSSDLYTSKTTLTSTRATTTYYSIPEIGYVQLPDIIPPNGALQICNHTLDDLLIKSTYIIYNIVYAFNGTTEISLPNNTGVTFTYLTDFDGNINIQANFF